MLRKFGINIHQISRVSDWLISFGSSSNWLLVVGAVMVQTLLLRCFSVTWANENWIVSSGLESGAWLSCEARSLNETRGFCWRQQFQAAEMLVAICHRHVTRLMFAQSINSHSLQPHLLNPSTTPGTVHSNLCTTAVLVLDVVVGLCYSTSPRPPTLIPWLLERFKI